MISRVSRIIAVVALAAASVAFVATPASATVGDITSYPIGVQSRILTSGPDGNLWFASSTQIGMVSATSPGAPTMYPVPSGSSITGLTSGPDGQLWLLDGGTSHRLWSFNLTTHVFTDYPLPSINSGPADIVSGPDGKIWFTEAAIGTITSFDPATQLFARSIVAVGSDAIGPLAVAPSGLLWFGLRNLATVGSFNPATSDITNHGIGRNPFDLVVAPDGIVWITGQNDDTVTSYNPATATFNATATGGGSSPYGITIGPDGEPWFALYGNEQLGTIAGVGGAFSAYTLPDPATEWPAGIVAGSDGNIWATGSFSQTLIRFEQPRPARVTTTTLPAASVNGAYSATVATTGTAPLTFSVTTGSLPAGLTLNAATGVISGTPTAAGTSTFTVTATNTYGSDAQVLSIAVAAAAALAATGVDGWITASGALALLLLGAVLLLTRRGRARA